MKPLADVVADFDGIAAALGANRPRETLRLAERALLRYVPARAATALDVGCGDGVLARTVASRGIRVLGIDLSPGMIAVARARTPPGLNADFRVAHVMTDPLPEGTFDVVMTVNAVHHLPLDRVVPRLAAAVAPGGVLLIQDVVTRTGPRNFLLNVLAAVVLRTRRFMTRSGEGRRVAALYNRHGVGERYLTPRDVEPAYRDLLPGVLIRHHLDWAYTVVWRRRKE